MNTIRLLLLLLVAMALTAAGCGGGDDESAKTQTLSPRQLEQAFLRGMVPHHESAVDMAEVALEEAEHPEIKQLAAQIVDDQTHEIDSMQRIHKRLFKTALKPDEGAHMKLGLTSEEAGMNHMNASESLRGENPFDRAFIDSMIPHHEGAIRMAKAVRAEAEDADVATLASKIISAQQREIAQMRRWRREWYDSSEADASGMQEHESAGH